MKNQKYTLTAAATFSAMLLLCGNAVAASDSAEINVSGKILANTCTIGSASYDVELPAVADRDIKGAGTVSAVSVEVPVLLTGCGADVSTVKVTASGTGSGNYFTNSVNATAGGATGVGIAFYQTDRKSEFKASGEVSETSDLNASGETTLTYLAKYIGIAERVTAGDVKAAVSMKFEYQ
jgi:major type 1 subunit fimbrin (pilin)